jgi:broad specificity phosphatase PhoE
MSDRQEIVLVRHGETEWSRSGQHTGSTDVPLTDRGRRQAERLGEMVTGRSFSLVLTSPLVRAAETCRLAGLGDVAEVHDRLREWDYGDYEGRTTAAIREEVPGWTVWTHGVPNGEAADDVGRRADEVIARIAAADGDAAVFGHGHMLRVLTARWCDLHPRWGRLFALDTATLSILGYERETRVIRLWNQPGERRPAPAARTASARGAPARD